MHLQLNVGRMVSGMLVVASFALLTPTLSNVGNVNSVFGYGAGLSVDNTTVLNGFAVADNSYDNGFKFRMRVTVDSVTEDGLAFRFDDWAKDGGGGTIPTTSNMQVNLSNTLAGATSVTNAYGSDIAVGADVDTGAPGVQKDVYVWLKVPVSTVGGSYSTTYGVRSTVTP